MTAEKRSEPAPTRPASPPAPNVAKGGGRKPWIRRSNVEVILAAIEKQERRVADLETELAQEKRELEKLSAAKKLLEAK